MASLSSLSSCSASGLLRPSRSRDPTSTAVTISFPRRRSVVVGRRGRGMRVAAAAKKYKGTAMREEKLAEMIERKVAEAMEVCEGEDGRGSDGCRVAWDEVEEVSQAKADLRRRLAESAADPLEPFCQENPETDECRVYED